MSFAQTIDYRLTKDTIFDDTIKLKKGTILECNKQKLKFWVEYSIENEDYEFSIYPLSYQNYNDLDGYDYYIELTDSIKLFENKYIDLLPVYYLDVLKNKNPALLYKYQPKWNAYKKNYKDIEGERFEEGFWPETIQVSNLYITVTQYNNYLIEKIIKTGEYYKLDLIKQNDIYTDNVPMPECFIQKAEKKEISLILKFDGDYLDLWIDSPKDDLYIGKYFVDTNKSTLWEIKNLVKGDYCNLNNVYWPRHADGTSDFDKAKKAPLVKLATNFESLPSDISKNNKTTVTIQPLKESSSVNVAKDKTMTVKENLKLRSGEATSTQVLTVMSAGTKVKILELGKSETIDGITSNWVKVELLADATDRDGNPIEKGTTGWCYGGYLEETEDFIADNEDEIITADVQAVQEATPEVIHSSNLLLIAILVSVGILLILVIILIILKKRNKKEDL